MYFYFYKAFWIRFFSVAEDDYRLVTFAKNPDIICLRFRGVTDSTNDFGSFSQGSNPCGTAKLKSY